MHTCMHMCMLLLRVRLFIQLDSVEPMQIDDPEDDTPIDFLIQAPPNFVSYR